MVAAFMDHIQALKAAKKGDPEVDLMVERAHDYFFECAGIVRNGQRQYFCNVINRVGGPSGPRSDRFTNVSGGGVKALIMLLGPSFQVLAFHSNGDN